MTNNATTMATLDPNSPASSGFLFFSDLKTQAEAETHCKLNGGHLAYFNNAADQNNVEQWLVNEVSAPHHKPCWAAGNALQCTIEQSACG